MRSLRRLAIPALLQTVFSAGCDPVTPADAAMRDATLDADDQGPPFPATCDGSYPARSCYDSCLYEGMTIPSMCSVYCAPIPAGGLFGVCNSSNPDYLCRLTHDDGGSVYVECLTLA